MRRRLEQLLRRLRRTGAVAPPPPVILPLFPRRPPPPGIGAELPRPNPPPESPPPPYAELRDLSAVATPVEAAGFSGGSLSRLTVYPVATPNLLRPLLANTEMFAEEWLGRWHRTSSWPSRDAPCYFATDAIVSGGGQVWIDGKLVTDQDVLASYVYQYNLGLPEAADALMQVTRLPVRDVEHACVVMPGTMRVYGHFLIETMFYVLMVQSALRGSGLDCRYLLPSSAAPWLVEMLCDDLAVARDAIEFYQPEVERVRLRRAVLPGKLHRDDGFHPAANELVDGLLDRLRVPAPVPPVPRVFLTRAGFHKPGSGARECTNEAALVELACARHGFAAVAMQDLPWREQIALMFHADIVLGSFGSAMHATLLAPHGTRVACLGFSNLVQSVIGALRGHDMAYLTKDLDIQGVHSIDEGEFGRFLDAVCAEEL